MPSIQKWRIYEDKDDGLSFKPYYKWNAFNTVELEATTCFRVKF